MKCYARFLLDNAKPCTLESLPDRVLQTKLSLKLAPGLSPKFRGYLVRQAGEPYPEVMGNKGPMAHSLPTRARHPVHSKTTALLAWDRVQTPEDSRPGP